MERSRMHDETQLVRSKVQSVARPNALEILGEPPSARPSSLHPEGEAARPSGRVTVANILLLLELQGFRCALTGRQLTPDTASLDHIVPVREGGEHRIENVQVLHKDVNRAKATMNNEEFVLLCREVFKHAAQKHRTEK